MPPFIISITQTSNRYVVVDAETSEKAIERTEKLYYDSKIKLDSLDFVEAIIEDLTDENQEIIDSLPKIDEY
ncbi:MAG: DpnD/PcfM family protein [Firmicutes bacterium]|nr:DpnD/PcfM family protein [Bacillota bacterium]